MLVEYFMFDLALFSIEKQLTLWQSSILKFQLVILEWQNSHSNKQSLQHFNTKYIDNNF
jgi:hypothetical protein